LSISPRRKWLAYALILTIGAVILTTEIGEYYLQSLSVNRSLNNSGGGPSGSGSNRNQLISVYTLVNYGNGTSAWYNKTDVATTSNFYDLTLRLANGNIEGLYYPTLSSHFIIGINGVRSDGVGSNCSYCWGIWIYCSHDRGWIYSTLGADLIKLNNGDVLAWYIQNISQNNPPQQGTSAVSSCSG